MDQDMRLKSLLQKQRDLEKEVSRLRRTSSLKKSVSALEREREHLSHEKFYNVLDKVKGVGRNVVKKVGGKDFSTGFARIQSRWDENILGVKRKRK